MTANGLPRAHIFLLASLYTTQYIGMAFFLEALIAIYRKSGMSLETLGIVYMLGLFWAIRFLWSSVIDRFRFKRIGHYRGWLLILQTLMVCTLFLVGSFDPIKDIYIVLMFCVLFAFLSASQDIAADALSYKLVHANQRGFANSLKVSGGLLGNVLGGGAALVVYAYLGWEYSVSLLALITAITLFQIALLKEPYKESENSKERVGYTRFLSFWKGAGQTKWLLLLLIYPVPISLAYGIMTPLLVDFGWGLDKIGILFHIIGSGIGVVSAMGTGWLIRVFGRKNILVWTVALQGFGILALLVPLSGYGGEYVMGACAISIMFLYSPSATVLATIMMDKITISPAADFAVQHSVYTAAGIVAAGVGMTLAGRFGYSFVVLSAFVFGIVAAFAAFKIYVAETSKI